MVATTSKKFSNIARTHFSDGLGSIKNDISTARFSMQYLRPRIRAVLLQFGKNTTNTRPTSLTPNLFVTSYLEAYY